MPSIPATRKMTDETFKLHHNVLKREVSGKPSFPATVKLTQTAVFADLKHVHIIYLRHIEYPPFEFIVLIRQRFRHFNPLHYL